ncbi:phage Gp37/Gp68 family protein [Ralstonia sp. Ralssp135]|uniref:phage Gp37/Gp68 family protein n=1 Tax=Ralstonia sp. Ralssp135 TaxID=3243016 RepID=UPI0039B09738
MSENSKIEWTDHTFNPWEGCQKVGPGCDHCYAETRNARFSGGTAVNWGPDAPRRRTSIANWRKPLAWDRQAGEFYAKHLRRQRVFCASLADIFDNQVPIQWLVDFLRVCAATPNLDKLVLTKRIGNVTSRLAEALSYVGCQKGCASDPMLRWIGDWLDGDHAPTDIWLGATVVNQAEADRDVPKLLCTPASVRFLSMEPLLGPVDLTRIKLKDAEHPELGQPPIRINALRGWYGGAGNPARLDWVIVGGESGPGARPMHPDWAISLCGQCASHDVPFLFKQWGEWVPMMGHVEGVTVTGQKFTHADGTIMGRAGKKAAGRLLAGLRYDGFPEGAV